MSSSLVFSNLTNPTLLFFVLGIVAVCVKSDLEVPAPSAKFISLYLLFSIGFKGGQELAHHSMNLEISVSLLFGMLIAATIPLYTFYLFLRNLGPANAGAVAATYGSVSAVTFVAAASFLEFHGMKFGGHMVAVMALMEAPAIVIGVLLMKKYSTDENKKPISDIVKHSLTNGSVLLIVGSLVIGYIADTKQAEGIKPFTTDIFKGFLALFLLEMGMVTARRIRGISQYGLKIIGFALVGPIVNGCAVAVLSQLVTTDPANRFMFAILAASASYIAVPATMRLAAPEADPGLYIPMALGLTFPLNITLGMPLYFSLVQ